MDPLDNSVVGIFVFLPRRYNQMGMYTALHYNVECKRDLPDNVKTIIQYMLDNSITKPELPEHELFTTTRWQYMFRCDSCYFAEQTHSIFFYDDIARAWFLCIRCNLKNYDNEIEKFVDWFDQYVEAYEGDFLGFSRYETTEDPTIIKKQ